MIAKYNYIINANAVHTSQHPVRFSEVSNVSQAIIKRYYLLMFFSEQQLNFIFI